MTETGILAGGAGMFLLGLVSGSTACSLSCLPYIGPYLISTTRGFRDGMAGATAFMLGKVCAYSTMSAGAAWLGRSLVQADAPYGRSLAGLALIGAGLALPFVGRRTCCGTKRLSGRGTSLFLVGFATSFTPCLPLAGLFAVAAHSGSVWTGLWYGLLYGTGLLVGPVVLAGGVFGLISGAFREKAQALVPALQGLSAFIMVAMGTRILLVLNGP